MRDISLGFILRIPCFDTCDIFLLHLGDRQKQNVMLAYEQEIISIIMLINCQFQVASHGCDLSVHRASSGTLDSVSLGVHSHGDLGMGLDSQLTECSSLCTELSTCLTEHPFPQQKLACLEFTGESTQEKNYGVGMTFTSNIF